MRIAMSVICVLGLASTASAASKTDTWTSEYNVWTVPTGLPRSEDPEFWFDGPHAALARSHAMKVIEATSVPNDAEYVIIHVLRWKTPPDTDKTALEIDKEN